MFFYPIAYVRYEPHPPTQPNIETPTIIRNAFYALEIWQLWLLLALAILLLLCCCCTGLLCWLKERKLQRLLIRRLAQESSEGAKVSSAGTPHVKRIPASFASNSGTFGPWRKARHTGASSPSNEFEYISFTSDASGQGTSGWNSMQNTLASNVPHSTNTQLVSRAVQSDDIPQQKFEKLQQRAFSPITLSTLDWPLKKEKRTPVVKENEKKTTEPDEWPQGNGSRSTKHTRKERVIPISSEEPTWSEEELDTNRMSFERLRREPDRKARSSEKKIYFGDNVSGLLNKSNLSLTNELSRGPTVVKRELIEEYEEITKHIGDDPSLVQDLIQVQIDEQTRSIISAIRKELKRFTPTERNAQHHQSNLLT